MSVVICRRQCNQHRTSFKLHYCTSRSPLLTLPTIVPRDVLFKQPPRYICTGVWRSGRSELYRATLEDSWNFRKTSHRLTSSVNNTSSYLFGFVYPYLNLNDSLFWDKEGAWAQWVYIRPTLNGLELIVPTYCVIHCVRWQTRRLLAVRRWSQAIIGHVHYAPSFYGSISLLQSIAPRFFVSKYTFSLLTLKTAATSVPVLLSKPTPHKVLGTGEIRRVNNWVAASRYKGRNYISCMIENETKRSGVLCTVLINYKYGWAWA